MKTVKATVNRDHLKKSDVTIAITMPLGDWEDLRKITTGKGWPLWEFSDLISSALTEILTATDKVAFMPDGEPSEQ